MWARHLLSVAILPFTVAVWVPLTIARRAGTRLSVGDSVALVVAQCVGVGLLAIGLVLFVTSLRRFVVNGKGTLAPWDPPRVLVVEGPYRYVRNPMISGVIFVLFGEALCLLSRPQAVWAATFLLVNAVYIPLFEEPQLRSRFGESYDEYCRHVSRLVPRVHAWNVRTSERSHVGT